MATSFSPYPLKHPTGTTYTLSSRCYGKSPIPVKTIKNEGNFMRVVSMSAAKAVSDAAPSSIKLSPPSFISISP